jgi:hypothetical protein
VARRGATAALTTVGGHACRGIDAGRRRDFQPARTAATGRPITDTQNNTTAGKPISTVSTRATGPAAVSDEAAKTMIKLRTASRSHRRAPIAAPRGGSGMAGSTPPGAKKRGATRSAVVGLAAARTGSARMRRIASSSADAPGRPAANARPHARTPARPHAKQSQPRLPSSAVIRHARLPAARGVRQR